MGIICFYLSAFFFSIFFLSLPFSINYKMKKINRKKSSEILENRKKKQLEEHFSLVWFGSVLLLIAPSSSPSTSTTVLQTIIFVTFDFLFLKLTVSFRLLSKRNKPINRCTLFEFKQYKEVYLYYLFLLVG